MLKPTTKDLAVAAGVSLATVDRVLNARDGVRQQTIDRVHDAIGRIGFVRDVAAANLARRREYRFAFVVPDRTDEFVATIARAVDDAAATARQDRIDVRLVRVPADDPHEIVRVMATLAEAQVDGIAVMAPETAPVRDAINRAQGQGIPIVTFVSDQPSAARVRFVGINDVAAGRTAATLVGRFCPRRPGAVIVVAETIQSRDSLDRRHGFDEGMLREFPWLATTPTVETWADPDRTDRVLRQALSGSVPLRAIYLMGSASAAALDTLSRHLHDPECVVVAHELTDATRAALTDGRLSAVINQDVGHSVRSALRILRAKADGSAMIEQQERIRIEILLRSNLPRPEASQAAE